MKGRLIECFIYFLIASLCPQGGLCRGINGYHQVTGTTSKISMKKPALEDTAGMFSKLSCTCCSMLFALEFLNSWVDGTHNGGLYLPALVAH